MTTFGLIGTAQRLAMEETTEGYVFRLVQEDELLGVSPPITRQAVQQLVYNHQRVAGDLFAMAYSPEHDAYELAFNEALPRRVVLCPAAYLDSELKSPRL